MGYIRNVACNVTDSDDIFDASGTSGTQEI